jgi:eukaryotic-like serine/threonine-protein kinase
LVTHTPSKLGRYDIIRTLGHGAMGVVYEGRDPNLDRRVAIKTVRVEGLSAGAYQEYEARFRTEARSAARLQHPHVVSVYDWGRDLDITFLVMEFVQGEDLKHHLDNGQRYSLAESVNMVQDLLSALDYAHRHNIVHRDIKPANMLIQAQGRVKLADFGVARIQDSGELTRTQAGVVGTLKYSAPEQVKGLGIDHRADLFSTGVVLYQLLTGMRPFDGDSFFSISQEILNQEPPPPSSVNPALTAELDAVLTKALAKNAPNRYQSAAEFSLALQAAAAQVPAAQALLAPSWAERSAVWEQTQAVAARTTAQSSTDTTQTIVSQELELVFWNDVKDSQDAGDLESYLKRFPHGVYIDLAKRRLKRLRFAAAGEGSYGSYTQTQVLAPKAPAEPSAAESTTPLGAKGARSTKAQTASRAATPHSNRRTMVSIGIVAVAAVALVWLALSTRSTAPTAAAQSAVPNQAPASAPIAAPSLAPSATLAASSATALATALAGAAPTKTSPPPKTAQRPASNAGAVAVSAAKQPTEEPKTTAQPHVLAAASPKEACEDRVLLGYQICLAKECSKPAFQSHPICVDRREMERRNEEAARMR